MEATKYYCRDIFSLSNEEIVKLVDFIFDDVNLDRLAHYLYAERPSLSRKINYRKIEVQSAHYDWAFVVKVTYGFEELERKVTTGFLVSMEGGLGDDQLYQRDVYIQSVSGFYKTMEGIIWEKGIADDFNIDVDFSAFIFYIMKAYDFFKNTLKIWEGELDEAQYLLNPHLKNIIADGRYTIQVIEGEETTA